MHDFLASDKASPPAAWIAYGIPDTLAVDNGLDLASFGVRAACTALGTHLFFTPPRSPWYKGTVERAGRTMNTRFIHWLPGTTLGKPTADLNYNGSDHAVLTFEAFEALLEQYFVSVHNRSPREGSGQTPNMLFLRGCQDWPVRVPASADEFDAAVALHRTKTLTQSGLHFMGLQYQNDALGELWNRTPNGTRLSFAMNPLDLKVIQVRHPATAEFFPVPCVTDLEWPRTLSLHTAARAYAKKHGLNADEKRDLAKAEFGLHQDITIAAATSKRALRRMQAELLRQSDATFSSEMAPAVGATTATTDTLIADAFDQAFKT